MFAFNDEQAGAGKMWTFKFYRDDAGEWRWRLRGGNGEIVGTGEGHPRLADAVRSAESFKAKVGHAQIVRPRVVRRRPQSSPLREVLSALTETTHRRT
jgi:uncharacterized protein YegP (UPF0339 family)